MRILIVEDDDMLRDGIAVGLRLAGFSPEPVASIANARAALDMGGFEAMVLDLMLSDGSGLDLLRDLRAGNGDIPVLVLTARDRLDDRVAGLDAGADDYLGKPFELDELAARLRAIMRRGQGRAEDLLRWNGLVLDPARMTARMTDQTGTRMVQLSRHEFVILQALLERPQAIMSKFMMEERLYGWQEGVESNTVEVHIHHLRNKLGRGYIETVRGAGYRLAAPRDGRK